MSETELERVRAELEQYMEAAHKAGVVFSVGPDGVRAEYNPALAKCVASWDADGEIEQPGADLTEALEIIKGLLRIAESAPSSSRHGDEEWIDRAAALLDKNRSKEGA